MKSGYLGVSSSALKPAMTQRKERLPSMYSHQWFCPRQKPRMFLRPFGSKRASSNDQTRLPSLVTGRGPQRAAKLAQKINLFRNRVNVLRNRDNLFSITSPLDLGRLARPRTFSGIESTQLHSYAVTQLHKV